MADGQTSQERDGVEPVSYTHLDVYKRQGMGWSVSDLSKPQIFVESTFGDSHPGSAHLDQFVQQLSLIHI